MKPIEIFFVVALLIIFIIYLSRRSSTKKQKANDHQTTLFLEMLKKEFPKFSDVINIERVTLFLYEWQKRRNDSEITSYSRTFSGVKRGKIVFLGGFKSSMEEGWAAEYVLKECGKHISDDFVDHLIERHTVTYFYAIQDMISTSKDVAHR